MTLKILLLFAGTVLAFWISAICGGGASLILLPLLNLVLPASLVPFSLTLGTFSSSASRIVVFRKNIRWNIVLWFVPFSIPAVLLGAWLIKFVNPLYLQLLVAIFLLSNIPQLFQSKQKQHKTEKPYPSYVLAIVGALAGFVSGITGAVGLLFNRFYLKYGLSKEEIVATRAANEIILHSIKLIIYIALGLYSQTAFYLGIVIALGAVLSSWSIKFILPYLSDFLFKKIGYGAMVGSGLLLFISTTSMIVQKDNMSLVTESRGSKNETTISWRESNFVLEYAYDDGLEIERPIAYSELPESLQLRFDVLKNTYDRILLEKVFRFREEPGYEFYCYRNGELTKFDFKAGEF